MRIFVGTLYSGENEYEECVSKIQTQSYQNIEHYIFRDLPNKEAHKKLFSAFLEKKENFDLLIKVDADMVLCSNDLFEKIVSKMNQFSEIDVFSIAVLDFFTGKMIYGLNTYRNTVQWDFSKQTMFVDIPEVSATKTVFDKTELAPAAIHCKNPSKFQSFHYGVHRGFKSIAQHHSTTHWAMLHDVWKNFLRTGDVRIGLAILGAELVYAGKFTKEDVDYTNPRVKVALEKYETMSSEEVKREILKLRIINWGFLPGDLRRQIIRNKYKDW